MCVCVRACVRVCVCMCHCVQYACLSIYELRPYSVNVLLPLMNIDVDKTYICEFTKTTFAHDQRTNGYLFNTTAHNSYWD